MAYRVILHASDRQLCALRVVPSVVAPSIATIGLDLSGIVTNRACQLIASVLERTVPVTPRLLTVEAEGHRSFGSGSELDDDLFRNILEVVGMDQGSLCECPRPPRDKSGTVAAKHLFG
jgi:hypothetical protein